MAPRLLSAIALLSAMTVSPALAATIEGTWLTPTGSEITVTPCLQGFCGSLSWIVVPPEQAALCSTFTPEEAAALMLDYKNPDRALQTRPLLGAELLTLAPQADGSYNARIYDVLKGETHDVTIWVNDDTLRLGAGCVMGMCAFTQDWPRAAMREAPGFTCDSPPPA